MERFRCIMYLYSLATYSKLFIAHLFVPFLLLLLLLAYYVYYVHS